MLRRALRRGSEKAVSRRCLEWPLEDYAPLLGVRPILVFCVSVAREREHAHFSSIDTKGGMTEIDKERRRERDALAKAGRSSQIDHEDNETHEHHPRSCCTEEQDMAQRKHRVQHHPHLQHRDVLLTHCTIPTAIIAY